MDEILRRYLQSRISLGEPELVLRSLDRRSARRCAARLARHGPARTSSPDGGAASRESSTTTGAARTGSVSPDEDGDEGESMLSDEEIDRLSDEATREEILSVPDMRTLAQVAESCVRCPLHETRKQVVFGEGDPDARVVCVGEAPGAREDETGRPFVGPAGQLLNRLLLSVGFQRDEVYICNVLKSRPPDNRDPRPDEVEACSPYLLRQIELVDPDVIVAFGTFASQTLLGVRDTLGRLRGRIHLYEGYRLVVTYHPAALLRNRSWTRPSWEDLQLVRRVVDGEAGSEASRQLGLV